ncbi:Uncharacterised protein [Enterobacter cloacae]|nr:Uncharacterised protein [Enterobacter cloacae]
MLVDQPQHPRLGQPGVERLAVFRQLRIQVSSHFGCVIRTPLAIPQAAALVAPGGLRPGNRFSPGAAIPGERVGQASQPGLGIGNQRGGVQLQGIKLGHVQQQKLNVRVGKERLGAGGKVGKTRADANH